MRLSMLQSIMPILEQEKAAEKCKYTTQCIKSLEFKIQGETNVWCFIVYRLRDYDVILGMDF